jgi:hypothetical protein
VIYNGATLTVGELIVGLVKVLFVKVSTPASVAIPVIAPEEPLMVVTTVPAIGVSAIDHAVNVPEPPVAVTLTVIAPVLEVNAVICPTMKLLGEAVLAMTKDCPTLYALFTSTKLKLLLPVAIAMLVTLVALVPGAPAALEALLAALVAWVAADVALLAALVAWVLAEVALAAAAVALLAALVSLVLTEVANVLASVTNCGKAAKNVSALVLKLAGSALVGTGVGNAVIGMLY